MIRLDVVARQHIFFYSNWKKSVSRVVCCTLVVWVVGDNVHTLFIAFRVRVSYCAVAGKMNCELHGFSILLCLHGHFILYTDVYFVYSTDFYFVYSQTFSWTQTISSVQMSFSHRSMAAIQWYTDELYLLLYFYPQGAVTNYSHSRGNCYASSFFLIFNQIILEFIQFSALPSVEIELEVSQHD